MKGILIATLSTLGLFGCEQQAASADRLAVDFVDKVPDKSQLTAQSTDSPLDETERAFAIEKAADVVVEYSADGAMGIRPPTGADGIQPNPEHEFEPNQLLQYFDSREHKDVVVVIIAKQTWSDEQLKSEINKLNQYFFALHYRRVVIQQGRGNGRGIHSDLLRPSKT